MNKRFTKILKILLVGACVIALAFGALWLIGLISAILWGVVWVGLLGVVGYAGYKLLLGKEPARVEINERQTVQIADFQETDKALEEYKRRLLPK